MTPWSSEVVSKKRWTTTYLSLIPFPENIHNNTSLIKSRQIMLIAVTLYVDDIQHSSVSPYKPILHSVEY